MTDPSPSLLSRELLAILAGRGDLRPYARGELLIAEGEQSDAMYILVEGQLKVFTRDDNGRELVYNILQPGEFFGEMFLDGGPRSASVKALQASRCIAIGHDQIRSFMKAYPEFAECLALKLIERLRHATAQIRGLALNDVYERTIALLDQVAVEQDGQRLIPTGLTQQEIADRVGATREMVNHILRDLVRGGFLARDDDRRMLVKREFPRHW